MSKKSLTPANSAAWQSDEGNAPDKPRVKMGDGKTARLNESDMDQQSIKRPIPASVVDATLSNLAEHSYLSQTMEIDPTQPLSMEIKTSTGKLTIYFDADENISIYRYPHVLAIHRRSLGEGDGSIKADFENLKKSYSSVLEHLTKEGNSED